MFVNTKPTTLWVLKRKLDWLRRDRNGEGISVQPTLCWGLVHDSVSMLPDALWTWDALSSCTHTLQPQTWEASVLTGKVELGC